LLSLDSSFEINIGKIIGSMEINIGKIVGWSYIEFFSFLHFKFPVNCFCDLP